MVSIYIMVHDADFDSLVTRVRDLTVAVKRLNSCSTTCGSGAAAPAPTTGCVGLQEMPNIVAYWGNGGSVDSPLSGTTSALEIPAIYNIVCLAFLLFDSNDRKEWVLYPWGGADTGPQYQDDPSPLRDIDAWLLIPDQWGRTKKVILSLGGAPATFARPVFDGIIQYDGTREEIAKKFAQDPQIRKIYETNRCSGFDIDFEGSTDRVLIDHLFTGTPHASNPAGKEFDWGVYVEELKAFYGAQMTIFTAAPEIAYCSLEMFARWFGMGSSGNTIFDDANDIYPQWPWDVFIGTQYYNNKPDAVKWEILGGAAGDSSDGLGLYWNQGQLAAASWDQILIASDFYTGDDENEFNKGGRLVGLSLMQAVNLFLNEEYYANMGGNMGILTPNGAWTSSNAEGVGTSSSGWSNYMNCWSPAQPPPSQLVRGNALGCT